MSHHVKVDLLGLLSAGIKGNTIIRVKLKYCCLRLPHLFQSRLFPKLSLFEAAD